MPNCPECGSTIAQSVGGEHAFCPDSECGWEGDPSEAFEVAANDADRRGDRDGDSDTMNESKELPLTPSDYDRCEEPHGDGMMMIELTDQQAETIVRRIGEQFDTVRIAREPKVLVERTPPDGTSELVTVLDDGESTKLSSMRDEQVYLELGREGDYE